MRDFPKSYVYVTSKEQADSTCMDIGDPSVMGVDTETTGLDWTKDRLMLVQIAVPGKPVYIFDIGKIGDKQGLQEVLNGSGLKVFHNAKIDLKFLHMAGIEVAGNVFDTMLAEQVILSGSSYKGFGLKDIAYKYLEIVLDKEFQKSNWALPPSQEQLLYAAQDAKVLPELWKCQTKELESLGLADTMDLENKVLFATVKMELAGFGVDGRAIRALKIDLAEDIEETTAKLAKLFPTARNFNSPRQILKDLQSFGLDVYSTKKEVLLPYIDRHPAVGLLLRYKQLVKRRSLLGSLCDEINPQTGRIHADYKQYSTTTGRYSCANPNLQGVPHAKEFRRCFAAAEGNVLVIADYSQIELRIIAEVAKDETMIRLFGEGEDIHCSTASIVNKKPIEEVTPAERQAAKAMNFGLIYGMGYRTFKQYAKTNYGVDLSDYETKLAVDGFFRTYKGIGRRLTILDGLFTREERTLGNRRRLWNCKPVITERANAAIQGTGSDILKQALVYVDERLLCPGSKVKLVGTVHDEIILECPENQADEVSKALKEAMEDAGRKYLKTVPVIADVSIGRSWADK